MGVTIGAFGEVVVNVVNNSPRGCLTVTYGVQLFHQRKSVTDIYRYVKIIIVQHSSSVCRRWVCCVLDAKCLPIESSPSV